VKRKKDKVPTKAPVLPTENKPTATAKKTAVKPVAPATKSPVSRGAVKNPTARPLSTIAKPTPKVVAPANDEQKQQRKTNMQKSSMAGKNFYSDSEVGQ
jgi:hypothetical protein